MSYVPSKKNSRVLDYDAWLLLLIFLSHLFSILDGFIVEFLTLSHFLRIREFILSRHFRTTDLTFISSKAMLFLNRSKTDFKQTSVHIRYYRKKISLHVSNIDSLNFLIFNSKVSPLSTIPNGEALIRFELLKQLRQLLSSIQRNPPLYSV